MDKDFNLMVGLRIREVREGLNMTREQFSELCDISDSFLAAVESGRKGITSRTLYRICSNANISADYIIFGKEHNFQKDMLLEMFGKLDEPFLNSAVRILTEYITSINKLKKTKEDEEASHDPASKLP